MKNGLIILVLLTSVSISKAQFQCGDSLIDIRDGKKYATVQIGNQCWLAENLNYGTMIITDTGGYLMTDNEIVEKYVWMNNDSNSFFDKEHPGAYYEFTEAIQYSEDTVGQIQGVCPVGWHIPSVDEYQEMVDFLGGTDSAGTSIKMNGASGFNATYGGWRCMMATGVFYDEYPGYEPPTKLGFLWTSSSSNGVGIMVNINDDNGTVQITKAYGNPLGYNVRCIKN